MDDGNSLTPYPSQPRFQFLQCVHIFRRIHGVALFQKFCLNHTLTVPKDREKHHHPSRQRSPSHKFGNSHGFRSFRPPDITAPALEPRSCSERFLPFSKTQGLPQGQPLRDRRRCEECCSFLSQRQDC